MMHFVLNLIHKCKKRDFFPSNLYQIHIKIQDIISKENKCGTFGVDF